jgi:hypothetical protein
LTGGWLREYLAHAKHKVVNDLIVAEHRESEARRSTRDFMCNSSGGEERQRRRRKVDWRE